LARQHAMTAQTAQQVSETRLADLEVLLEQRSTQIQDLQQQRDSLLREHGELTRLNRDNERLLSEARQQAKAVATHEDATLRLPASLEKLAPDNVVFRALSQKLNIVTTAVAWNADRPNPLVGEIVERFRAK
ncbi:hypothetical protein ACM9HO_01945, partial [Pseudomonas sp. KHB2.9]